MFVQRLFRIFCNLNTRVYNKLERTVPGFNTVMEKVRAEVEAKRARKEEEEKKAAPHKKAG